MTLPESTLRELLSPYVQRVSASYPADVAGETGPLLAQEIVAKLGVYLDLLTRWNKQMNLTAVRRPEDIVRRHFGESLFLASRLRGTGALLDLGSGAGFPGIPIQLLHPELDVTLAESQGKKASFLREVVRVLQLPSKVVAARVLRPIAGLRLDVVTLRAVDDMREALQSARRLEAGEVWIIGSAASVELLKGLDGFTLTLEEPVPDSAGSRIACARRIG